MRRDHAFAAILALAACDGGDGTGNKPADADIASEDRSGARGARGADTTGNGAADGGAGNGDGERLGGSDVAAEEISRPVDDARESNDIVVAPGNGA